MIHYSREDKDYKSWSIWVWEYPQGEGKEFEFNGKDSYGVFAHYPLSNWSDFILNNNLGFIVKAKHSWNKKDCDVDRRIVFKDLEKDENGIYHVYLKSGIRYMYSNEKGDAIYPFRYAKFVSFKEIEFETNSPLKEFSILRNGEVIKHVCLKEPSTLIKTKLNETFNFNNKYQIEAIFTPNGEPKRKTLRFIELFKDKKFSKQFNYDGQLGVILKKESTIFKVWSPLSSKIVLKVYKSGTPKYFDPHKGNDDLLIEKEMIKGKKGVFSITIDSNLHGYYYTYVVTNNLYKEREVADPYAKSTGINGYRGMIVDFSKTNPSGFSKIKIHPIPSTKLVVYETHIADITSSSTWTNNEEQRKLEKTFLGACLEGTIYSQNGRSVKTGFDHIKELGVNAVQLLPIFDQANNEAKMTFNWGYNPVNYNTLDGGYSTNPYDGLVRIQEFKTLVKKYHDAGINIIMDVVYNHVNGAVASNFDVLMPGYYFRHNSDTSLSNGSGCGNETASEMYMYQKFMIDSLIFWASEYKLAGFRFDLMGIHDLDTMNKISAKLHEIDANITLYGEPWCGGCTPLNHEIACNKENISKFENFGAFNDSVRNALIKPERDIRNSGWITNQFSSSLEQQRIISNAIRGSFNPEIKELSDPIKVLNYVSCHDNYTIKDRIISLGIKDETDIKKMAMLSNAIVLTSNGISFILSGEEFLRTKQGVENSYNSSYKINELDYSLKLKNLDMFRNYQKLINLKKNVSDLCLDKTQNLLLGVDISTPSVISYQLDDVINHLQYKVYHVNGYRDGKPLLIDLSGYKLYLDTINPRKELTSKTQLVPFETLIVYKEN